MPRTSHMSLSFISLLGLSRINLATFSSAVRVALKGKLRDSDSLHLNESEALDSVSRADPINPAGSKLKPVIDPIMTVSSLCCSSVGHDEVSSLFVWSNKVQHLRQAGVSAPDKTKQGLNRG